MNDIQQPWATSQGPFSRLGIHTMTHSSSHLSLKKPRGTSAPKYSKGEKERDILSIHLHIEDKELQLSGLTCDGEGGFVSACIDRSAVAGAGGTCACSNLGGGHHISIRSHKMPVQRGSHGVEH